MKFYQKTGIVCGIGAALLWVSIQFLYVPQLSKVQTLRDSLVSNKQRNSRVNDLGKDKKFFDNLMIKITAYHKEVKLLMPKEIKLSGLLRELSILAQKNDVSLLSIRPLINKGNNGEPPSKKDMQSDDLFVNTDIEIVLECRYENLGRYVQAVENNTLTVMAIKDIQISADAKIDDPSRLKVVVLIEAFYKG